MGRGRSMKALDFDASLSTATRSDIAGFGIVHIAKHALLDTVHPELSGLVLSLFDRNGKPQNGFLRLRDIYNLKLSAGLVVLSACQTGLGKDLKGEGLVGLSRGFMYAGVPRVVASLWNVDDVSTAALMQRFYQAMVVENLPPAAAFQEAQLYMSKQRRWASPYY
jgi:CHAT domain-containing protein